VKIRTDKLAKQAKFRELDETQQAYGEQDRAYSDLFKNILNGFAHCRMLYKNGQPDDFIYLKVNQAFEAQTGLKDVVGRKFSEVIPNICGLDPKLLEIYSRVALGGPPEKFEIYLAPLQDWYEIAVYSPKPEQFIAIFDVITVRKKTEKEIQYLAYYDLLTRLPNRRLLVERLQTALADVKRSGKSGAVLFMDLDNFKTLNDTLGHELGDQLLQKVAWHLEASVRLGDTVARIGGDEFVVILEELSAEPLEAATDAELVARKILTALNQTYQLAEHKYLSTTSIGISLFTQQSPVIDELLKQADIAMYQAKKAGRNTLRFFDPQMQASINARASLEVELRYAIHNQEFRLHYQAQVAADGRVMGAEALIRWQHPRLGLVAPAYFIALAEETGQIIPIGLWVLDTVCAQLKVWREQADKEHLIVSVNVSAKQFHQKDFVADVQAVIQAHGINPARLKLEPTESILLDNIEEAVLTMTALQEIGVNFALDDFGTGFSSLQYLKKLPLKQLKVDQSFVRDVLSDSSDQVIVRTIITMAHSLNLEVIAEGVETPAQLQFLQAHGCDQFQGFLFGQPVSIAEFEQCLRGF
jgi:diguanylate cyclase (GGDEF)-like protein